MNSFSFISIRYLCVAVCVALLTGCVSTSVVLTQVGPCSTKHEASDSKGHLQVFSVMEAQSEGDDPVWYQHSAYVIYDIQGKRFKYVGNTIGKFDETPPTVTLPAGRYVVRALAEGFRYPLVKVPVAIEPGKTTAVHLENGWSPPSGPPGTEIVKAPIGYAMGWRAADSSASFDQ
jgi:hypothetical protein